MSITILRVIAGLVFLPALWFAALTFMAPRDSLADYALIYLFWLVPGLCLATALGLWWTMPAKRLLPFVAVLPVLLWAAIIGLFAGIGYLTR